MAHDTAPQELADTLALLTELIGEIQTRGFTGEPGARVRRLVQALRSRPQLVGLPGAVLTAYNEIAEALHGIRLTRQTIQAHALDRLRHTAEKLSEVTATTESAATEILNGLDRSLAALDRLDGEADERRSAAAAALRAELNQLFGHLQFQDITSQQLRGVMQLLAEVEERITRVAELLDHSLNPGTAAPPRPQAAGDPQSYNPDATALDVTRRQKEADITFLDAVRQGAAP
jgi:chemotaxis regulatin CheY-phosphate phosphatase CheZ